MSLIIISSAALALIMIAIRLFQLLRPYLRVSGFTTPPSINSSIPSQLPTRNFSQTKSSNNRHNRFLPRFSPRAGPQVTNPLIACRIGYSCGSDRKLCYSRPKPSHGRRRSRQRGPKMSGDGSNQPGLRHRRPLGSSRRSRTGRNFQRL